MIPKKVGSGTAPRTKNIKINLAWLQERPLPVNTDFILTPGKRKLKLKYQHYKASSTPLTGNLQRLLQVILTGQIFPYNEASPRGEGS